MAPQNRLITLNNGVQMPILGFGVFQVPDEQTEQVVTDALAALPFPQRAVVILHHFEGLSYAEVAEVTRSSVPAVRSHLFRARRTLGTKLEEWR